MQVKFFNFIISTNTILPCFSLIETAVFCVSRFSFYVSICLKLSQKNHITLALLSKTVTCPSGFCLYKDKMCSTNVSRKKVSFLLLLPEHCSWASFLPFISRGLWNQNTDTTKCRSWETEWHVTGLSGKCRYFLSNMKSDFFQVSG